MYVNALCIRSLTYIHFLCEKSENIKSSLIYESKKDAKADEDNIEELEDFLDDLL